MIAPPPGWAVDGIAWTKTFACASFDGSVAFINAIAAEANRQDHHPDLALSWDEVTVRTWSHDTGTITERDLRLALAIDAIALTMPGD